MKFYQKQIIAEHPNIAKYRHILINIQNCYNAVRLNRRKDELEATTEMYSDGVDASNDTSEEDKEQTYDIDLALVVLRNM